jgi:MFS family permease
MVQSTTRLPTRVAPATSALFVGAALSSAVIATTSTVAALVAVDAVGPAWGGVPGTAAVVGTGTGALLVTSLTRRYGTPTALRLGYLSSSLGAATGAVAVPSANVGLLVGAMLLIGLGNAAAQLSRYAAAELVPPRRRGFAIGLIVWAGTVGAVGGPLLLLPTARFAETLGQPALSGAFLLSVPAGLFAALAVSRLRTARRPASSSRTSVRTILVSPAGRDGLAVMVTGQVVMAIVMTSVPVQLHLHHHGLDVVGLVLSAHTLGMFALSPLTGRLVDRLSPGPVMAFGLVTLFVSTVVAASGDLAPQAVGLFALGYGWNLCFVAGSASLAVGLPEEGRAGVEGSVEAVVWISAAAGTLTSTVVLAVGGWSTLTLAAGSLVLVPALLLLSDRPRSRRAIYAQTGERGPKATHRSDPSP